MSDEKGTVVEQEKPAKKVKNFKPKQCDMCHEEFLPEATNQKRCRNCAPNADEGQRIAEKNYRDHKHKAKDKKAESRTSPFELKHREAVAILEQRGLTNTHVIQFCAELAERAAKAHKIPFNSYLLTHGLRATLAKEKLTPVEKTEVEGEILYRPDLHALWDYGYWRHLEVTFEQWLETRLRLKSSAFALSQLLGKSDFGDTHRAWEKFLPRWNPIGLHPDYTQQQGLAWLDGQRSDTQGDKKRYLLIASRNSMKSTFARIHALCFTLCYPDGPIMFVSETNKLSRKAMREFRGYLEMAPNAPTEFQQLFGEYCVGTDDGSSLTYENPLAHLGLPQVACESSSMESANTGSRFTVCYFDDPISRDNGTANEDQKAAAVSKFGSISKLREPAGFVVNIQTPWAVGDLGDVMMKQNESDEQRPLAVRIDPVFTIKDQALGKITIDTIMGGGIDPPREKELLELTEDDVVLNFLPKLNWKFVRNEMRSPEGLKFFRTQYLCEWVPDDEDLLRLQFDLDTLKSSLVTRDSLNQYADGETYLYADVAHSTSRYADRSVVAALRTFESHNDQKGFVVLAMKSGRWTGSELALEIAMMSRRHPDAKTCIMEKPMSHDLLRSEVERMNGKYGTAIQLYFTQQPNTKDAKMKKLKSLELAFTQGLIRVVSDSFADELFAELQNLNGLTNTRKKKDDRGDVLGLAATMIIRPEIKGHEVDPQLAQQMEEELEREWRKQAHYNRMFGNQYVPPPQKMSDHLNDAQRTKLGLPPRNRPNNEPEKPVPVDPRDRVFSYGRSVAPSSNGKNTLFGARGFWRKPK